MLSKIIIRMTKIFAFGKEYKIEEKVMLKPDKIKKILIWLVSYNQTAVKAFLGIIQLIKHWIFRFTEL